MSEQKVSPQIQSLLRSSPTRPKRFGTSDFPHTSTTISVRPANKNDPNGYYNHLGLQPNANRKEIKAAFMAIAKEKHPDVGGDVDEFQFITQVYEVLSHSETKFEYDTVPEGMMYVGQYEMSKLFSEDEAKRERTIAETERLIPETPSYGYFAHERSTELAEKWYEYILPVFQILGIKANVRLILDDSPPKIKCNGVRKDQYFLTLPRTLAPNFFTAFYLVTALLNSLVEQ